MCTDFLSLKPEVMGHVTFDPAIEAAVNRMSQFPLSNKKSKAAGDLAQIALKVVKESMLPRSGWGPPAEEPEEPRNRPWNLCSLNLLFPHEVDGDQGR